MTLGEIVSDYIREYRDHARKEMRSARGLFQLAPRRERRLPEDDVISVSDAGHVHLGHKQGVLRRRLGDDLGTQQQARAKQRRIKLTGSFTGS